MSKITQEVLDAHRNKEAKVFVLRVDVSEDAPSFEGDADKIEEKEGVYYALLRKPLRRDISFAMSSKTPLDMGDALIQTCWIDGDPEIKDIAYQDTIGVIAAMQAVKLMEVGQGALKKI
jgi:hypothetical protein